MALPLYQDRDGVYIVYPIKLLSSNWDTLNALLSAEESISDQKPPHNPYKSRMKELKLVSLSNPLNG